MSTATTSFQEVWAKADKIFGWLTEPEARALYEAALETPDNGTIVEVGSYMGRSLTVLAETGRRIISVDPLELGMSIAKNKINDATVASLMGVVTSYPNVTWHRKKSEEMQPPACIDLLYIDACHKYPFPLRDYRAFESGLYPGALVAFHDYCRDFGVTKTVDELLEAGEIEEITRGETMIVTRKR